jgi:hypothetical protein
MGSEGKVHTLLYVSWGLHVIAYLHDAASRISIQLRDLRYQTPE